MRRMGPYGEGVPISSKREGGGNTGPGGLPSGPVGSELTEAEKALMMAQSARQNYHNPDPLYRLLGPRNESTIIVNGNLVKMLVDSGAQITTITEALVRELGLEIQNLGSLLDLGGTGGCEVPYKGYVIGRIALPAVQFYEGDSYMLVLPDHPYGDEVPIQLGTKHIDRIMDHVQEKNISVEDEGLKRAIFSRKLAMIQANSLVETEQFSLEKVKGNVRLLKAATLSPFESRKVKVKTQVNAHSMRVNVIVEQPEKGYSSIVGTAQSYTHMKPGSKMTFAVIRNLSGKNVTIPAKTIVGQLSAANMVPPMLVQNPECRAENDRREPSRGQDGLEERECVMGESPLADDKEKRERSEKPEPLDDEQLTQLLEKLDLSETKDWTTEEQ